MVEVYMNMPAKQRNFVEGKREMRAKESVGRSPYRITAQQR